MENSIIYKKNDTATNGINIGLLNNEIQSSSIETPVVDILINGLTEFVVVFETPISAQEETVLNGIVAAHEHITTAETMKIYLDDSVFPFINNVINAFAAENIAMGITQAGKTGDVLGIFEKRYDIGYAHPVSLKGSFDTGSLYVSLEILQHVRDNPGEFSGLSPFVTDARLLEMKNKIETFLGVTPLST